MEHGIDLIVVNYRTPDDLGRHLQSLERHLPSVPHSLAIVNVDPLERDDEVAETWKWKFDKPAASARFDTNVGYAQAVNATAAFVKSHDTIGIFNADTRFREHVIDNCVEALWSNDRWGILGPCQVDDHNRVTHGGFFGTRVNKKERGFRQHWNQSFTDVRSDAVTVSGAAYFVKRHVWDELTSCPMYAWANAKGAFLPTPHYYEETWCSYHAIAHGYKVVYYGAETMVHQWHRASKIGTVERTLLPRSRELFETACEHHNIEIG